MLFSLVHLHIDDSSHENVRGNHQTIEACSCQDVASARALDKPLLCLGFGPTLPVNAMRYYASTFNSRLIRRSLLGRLGHLHCCCRLSNCYVSQCELSVERHLIAPRYLQTSSYFFIGMLLMINYVMNKPNHIRCALIRQHMANIVK